MTEKRPLLKLTGSKAPGELKTEIKEKKTSFLLYELLIKLKHPKFKIQEIFPSRPANLINKCTHLFIRFANVLGNTSSILNSGYFNLYMFTLNCHEFLSHAFSGNSLVALLQVIPMYSEHIAYLF